jgi:hypothetical protein
VAALAVGARLLIPVSYLISQLLRTKVVYTLTVHTRDYYHQAIVTF